MPVQNYALLRDRQHQGAYQLVSVDKRCGVEVPHPSWWRENALDGIERVKAVAENLNFTANQLAKWLGIPSRTARHLLGRAIEKGLILRLGSGPNTRYSLI